MVMDSLSRAKSNTPALIRARGEDAKFKRDVNAIRKSQKISYRKYKISERKNTSTQRGIVSLLGNNVYLDPGIKHASVLYGQNIPGFCYKRNGEARRPISIYESKTSRVIHSLDTVGGALEDQAANVVSDSPILDEILSSPEILPILCDLRTTALLGKNPQLLEQFVAGLTQFAPKTLSTLFPSTQDGLTSLHKYRAHLIRNLFDAIRIQAELRLNSEAREVGRVETVQSNSASHLYAGVQTQENENWNQALMNKLLEIAAEDSPSPDSGPVAAVVEPDWETHLVSSVVEVPGAEESTTCPATDSKPKCKAAKRYATAAELKSMRRAQFTSIITKIIAEIQDVEDLGKLIREIRRQNPCRAYCSKGVLEKLLKEDTFTSLNSEYCELLKSDGKVTQSEYRRCLATVSTTSTLVTHGASKVPSFNFYDVLNQVHQISARIRNQEKVRCRMKTTNRLCCPACKAKLRHGYETFRERDEKFQKQIERSGKSPRQVQRELSKRSEVSGFQRTQSPSFNLYDLPGSALESRLNLNSLHIQDSPFLDLDEPSLVGLPLSLGLQLSTLNSKTDVVTPKPAPPLSSLKVFPELHTPQSFPPSPVTRFTVPVPSPGPLPPGIRSNNKKLQRSRIARASGGNVPKESVASWTLKVTRYDLFKFRQELQRQSMEERMLKFTKHLAQQNAEGRRNLPITEAVFRDED